jgi:hypothetical protein
VKRYKGFYPQVCAWENLETGDRKARKGWIAETAEKTEIAEIGLPVN